MPDGEGSYLLATAGADSLVRLWLIEIDEEAATAQMRMVREVHAHGGGASCVRWGGAGLLASAGGDRWARVWRGRRGEGEGGGGEGAGLVQLRAVAAVPAGGAGGAPAVALLDDADGGFLVAVGTLSGELALWRLPAEGAGALDDDADAPRFWDEAGVVRWLREYVTRAPGMGLVSAELAVETEEAARAAALSGARLLDDAVPDLLAAVFGCSEDEEVAVEEKSEEAQGRAALRARLRDELEWLRRAPPPPALARAAPHALLCPLSHRLLREPARAADGFSYERRALREWLVAGGSSPLSGRRLRNARLHPNYALRDALRAFLRDQAGDE
ncbi:WD repeat, SAM and U-box domain-containing protein 1-like [Ostrinia nubilalis]|uniref:WD repeat, SAM and U-box domain-containing protein 1-like n=1 Tax=Ostrinia nubilalis TaxID=29057 RepID=UPI0030823A7C